MEKKIMACVVCGGSTFHMLFSHRSGETTESILADLAFGFQADFFKISITGKEREAKIKRLIEIENDVKRIKSKKDAVEGRIKELG